jgi:hypothetical protein
VRSRSCVRRLRSGGSRHVAGKETLDSESRDAHTTVDPEHRHRKVAALHRSINGGAADRHENRRLVE